MSTVSRQLRDWCRRHRYRLCSEFVRGLDDALLPKSDLGPSTLLAACRRLSTGFFQENELDRETIARELSDLLEMPAVQVRLVKLTEDRPTEPVPVGGEEEPPDVFISYYHEDRSFVQRLASALAGRGFVVWYDELGLTAGASFPLVIERALDETRYVALVASARSVERPWVKKERAAVHQRETEEDRRILIPLRIDDSDLPLFVRSTQWCDFRTSFDNGLDDLVGSL